MKQPQDVKSHAEGQSRSTVGLGIDVPDDTIIFGPTSTSRTVSLTPAAYRLAKKPDGELILQGAYFWQEVWSLTGHEWRDIETVEL